MSSTIVCAGTSVTITPNGASTYTLSPGSLTSSTNFVVTPTVTTVYTISATSVSGCLSTASTNLTRTVTVNATPTVGLASMSSTIVCAGTSVTITPNGASTYTLSPGGSTSSTNFVVTPTVTTVYTISATSVSGCLSTASTNLTRTVTVNATPTISISSVSSPTICRGNTSVINVSGASTYTLQPGSLSGSSFTVSPTTSTTFTIRGTSISNCPSSNGVQQLITVNALPSVTISAIKNVSCFGLANGSVTLTPFGGSGSNYTITPATTTSLSPGTYTYVVKDGNSCLTSTVISISQPTAVLSSVITNTSSNTSCTAPNGTATVSVSGGTPSYTVTWNNGSVGTTVSNLNTGNNTYTVTDANSCVNGTGTFVTSGVTGITTMVASQTTVSCFGGNNGSLIYTTSGGSGYSYTLTSSSSTQTNTTGSFTNLPAGSYSLNVVDNLSGCIDVDVVSVSSPANAGSIDAITTASVLCYGGVGTVSASVSGGTSPYIYNWSSNTSTVSTASYAAGTYSLSITDANNCLSATQPVTISEPLAALTVVTNTTSNYSCVSANGTAIIIPSGGTGVSTVTWTAGSAINSYTNTGLPTGIVNYIVMDVNGCSFNGTAAIGGVSQPAVSSSQIQDALCYGQNTGSINIVVSGGTPTYTYNWSNTTSNVSSQTNLPVGFYTVTIVDAGGCTVTQTLIINEPTGITVSGESTSPSCPDKPTGNASISITGGTPSYNVSWNNGQTGNLSNVNVGIYSATITDAKGCIATYSLTIKEESCLEIFIPEMFTPNGDGKNDIFSITKIEDYPNSSLNIFNRWGSLVYTKKGYKNDWDGKANVGSSMGAAMLPAGTYYFILDLGDGTTKPYSGFMQLEY